MSTGEKDMRAQMPLQSWLTSQIIMDIDTTLNINPNISLKEYIDGQKKKTNVWNENSDFPIYNIGYLFMMAYAFLVVPKESIEKYGLNVFSAKIEKYLDTMTIRTNRGQRNLGKIENIIRHIRNAISHANIDIVPEHNKLIFVDEYQDKTTFDGDMEINKFKAFLVEYYKTYYESYHQKFISK